MVLGQERDRLIAVIVIILVIAALKISYPVTMPIAAAAFVIAVAWPVKPFLDRRLPGPVSDLLTLLLLAAISVGVIAALYYAISDVVETLSARESEFRDAVGRYLQFARRNDLPTFDGEESFSRLVSFGQSALAMAYSALGYLGLIAVLVVLGLPEVPRLGARLRRQLRESGREEIDTAMEEIASKFRHYLGVTLITSIITGIASGGFVGLVGLDLWLIWGVLNFLLNFVPVVGNIVGILPPTLYAFVQFQDVQTTLIVFGGLSLIQLVISNFIYPFLQGKGMAMPSVFIIVALTFWGWVWGLAGALLAVPLTAAVLIACQQFRSSAWIADLVIERR